MIFKRLLVEIKRRRREDSGDLYVKAVIGFLLFAVPSVVVDAYLPFDGIWMFLRAVLLIPILFFGFCLAYAASLELNLRQLERDPQWVPLRARWSPKWRRNLSFIIAAFLVVLTYAFDFFIGYTLFSAGVLVIGASLLAFCRMTLTEKKRAEYGVPDPRDTNFHQRLERQRAEREEIRRRVSEDDEGDDHTIYDDDDERIIQREEQKSAE